MYKKMKKNKYIKISIGAYICIVFLLLMCSLVALKISVIEIIVILIMVFYLVGTLSLEIFLSDNFDLYLSENYEDANEELLIELNEILEERRKGLLKSDISDSK